MISALFLPNMHLQAQPNARSSVETLEALVLQSPALLLPPPLAWLLLQPPPQPAPRWHQPSPPPRPPQLWPRLSLLVPAATPKSPTASAGSCPPPPLTGWMHLPTVCSRGEPWPPWTTSRSRTPYLPSSPPPSPPCHSLVESGSDSLISSGRAPLTLGGMTARYKI